MFKAHVREPHDFTSLTVFFGYQVTFGDNSKGKVLGVGNIGGQHSQFIKDVYLVDSLKYNLLSISQLCDLYYKLVFEPTKCLILSMDKNELFFTGFRKSNIYVINLSVVIDHKKCLIANAQESWCLWHRRLGHANMDLLTKIPRKELVRGLPKISYDKDQPCKACQLGKQYKTSFKSKQSINTTRPLELLHLDLFGPT